VADQRVREVVRLPIRRRHEQLRGQRLVEPVERCGLLEPRHAPRHLEGHAPGERRRDLQQAPCALRQPAEPALEHLPHGRRHRQARRGSRAPGYVGEAALLRRCSSTSRMKNGFPLVSRARASAHAAGTARR
jgi:hypothetical protein